MSDSNQDRADEQFAKDSREAEPGTDWLDEELSKLGDLDAPSSLLPKVMHEVRELAARPWWARLLGPQSSFARSFVLALSILAFAVSLFINPLQIAGHLPGLVVVMNLASLMLDTIRSALLHIRVFNYSLLPLVLGAVVFSYILLVASASTIQRFAGIRK